MRNFIHGVLVVVALVVFTAIAPNFYGDVFRIGSLATASFPTASAGGSGAMLWDSTLKKAFLSNGTTWNEVSDGPVTLNSVPLTGLMAVATFGGEVLPARAFTVAAIRFRISVAGNTGSTNAVLRVSDGTNNCDAAFACNSAAVNYRVATTGTCTFAASASLTYSVNAVGDCVTPPTILGGEVIEGNWR